MLGAKGQLKENIAHNPDAGRMSISQIRELTETIKNQDSANISSSSMLNRLDSYIKESQHYRRWRGWIPLALAMGRKPRFSFVSACILQ